MQRTREGLAAAWVTMLCAVGCAAGDEARPPPASGAAPAAASEATRVPWERPDGGDAIRARLSTTPWGTWIDVRVAADGDASMRLCEALVERERSTRVRAMDEEGGAGSIAVTRDCGAEPLPPIDVAARSYVLVVEHELGAGDLALMELPAIETRASVIELHQLDDAGSCEALRVRLAEASPRGYAEADASAQVWLTEQLARLDAEVARACTARDEMTARCAVLPARSLDRNDCDIDRTRAERECENARALAGLVRDRAASPSAQPAGPEPRCVPAAP